MKGTHQFSSIDFSPHKMSLRKYCSVRAQQKGSISTTLMYVLSSNRLALLVNYSTFHEPLLRHKLNGFAPADLYGSVGRRPVLGDIEGEIVEWVIDVAACGAPIQKCDLISSISLIVKERNIDNPFTDGKHKILYIKKRKERKEGEMKSKQSSIP